ncbi:retrotransposon protein, putative, ty1-copia subclass, partial [Tanacetum coccineum]
MEWYRNLWIVLSNKDKLPFLEQPIPTLPVPPEGQANLLDVADQELLQTVRDFHACKQEEGQSVSSYVLKMKSYIGNLERLGHAMTQNLSVSLILVSLRKEYDGFVQNYNMHCMGKTVTELHAMLKPHEQTLPPKEVTPTLHAIKAGRIQKNQKKKSHKAAKGNQRKGKAKMGNAHVPAPSYAPRPKNPSTPKKDNPVKDATCHQCGEVGHWRRNCPIYLAELMKKKKLSQGASTSGIFTIESILFLVHLQFMKRVVCVACMSEKMARKPYSHQVERAKDLLGLIHTDVCGPFKIMSRQGASYFVSFTNDFSRYGYVYMLKHKHEVFETFKVFQKEVENQLGKIIKSLRSDRGGECMSQEFLDHLKDHGIISHRTPPYTPQHNGVSERRNRTLLDMVQSMMSQTTLPKSFWNYTLESAARILNMVPTKKVDKTPYEIWHGQAPKLSYLKVWGCKALVKHDTLTKPDKLEPISIKCIFIGYPKEMMGYSFYYPPENNIFVARNAEFLKNSLINHEAKDDQEIDEPQSDINPIRRSTRTCRTPDHMCLYIDVEEHELGNLGEPANYKAALLDPESDKWLNAMNVEIQSMKDNKVSELVDLPPNGKIVGHKWLFKKKTDMDGALHTYKARLVAKGFTQTLRIEYEETFSPVAYIRAIRILIAIATFYDYEIWQIDVKTAFLNGYLNEEVYMEQPEGDAHWTAVKNILKYLCNTKDMFLVYRGVVDWKNIKQSIFATLSTDAEYIAAFDTSKEAVWIRKFISGLGVIPTIKEPINMYCDNTRAIAIAKDHGVTKGSRHFGAKVHYLQETIEVGDVKIEKVNTDDNLA